MCLGVREPRACAVTTLRRWAASRDPRAERVETAVGGTAATRAVPVRMAAASVAGWERFRIRSRREEEAVGTRSPELRVSRRRAARVVAELHRVGPARREVSRMAPPTLPRFREDLAAVVADMAQRTTPSAERAAAVAGRYSFLRRWSTSRAGYSRMAERVETRIQRGMAVAAPAAAAGPSGLGHSR